LRPFALQLPRSLEEALSFLGRHGDAARPLAGGTVLLPDLSHARLAPSAVVDLSRAGLGTVGRDGDGLVIGSTATYRQLERAAAATSPSRTLAWVASVARDVTGGPQIRNRGTIGGSAAYANPSSDVPALLVALEAVMTVASVRGRRSLAAAEFFAGPFATALAADELLVSIAVPAQAPDTRFGYEKLKFGESSWPIVTAAALLREDGSARVALGGSHVVPAVVEVRERGEVAEALSTLAVERWSDVLADAAYRSRVAPVVARRALERAATRPT
jgi:aerobic carbon-monoxide dehydrogenase medium subunit